MPNFTQIAYLWGPVVLAIIAIIVVSLVVNSDTKDSKKLKQPLDELKLEPEPVLEPKLVPKPAPVKKAPMPPAASARFKVVYTNFDDSEQPALLSLQGDLIYGTLRTGDFVRAEHSNIKVRINCMSDYGNHIADEITKLDDCIILIETANPNYIHEGETLVKD